MEKALNIGSFEPLASEEMLLVDAGGPVSLFISMVGIAWAPVVACANPAAGIGLGLVCVGVFYDNL